MDMVGVTDGRDYASYLLLEEKNFVTVKNLFTVLKHPVTVE